MPGAATRSSIRFGTDPDRLVKHGLTFDDVLTALQKNNRNVGGGGIQRNNQFMLVHGFGRPVNEEQIRNIVIAVQGGCADPDSRRGRRAVGHELRRGSVTADGKGEAVLGLGFMTMGENSKTVTEALTKKLDEIRADAAARRRSRSRLRPHRTGGRGHRHGPQEPVRGRVAGHRRAVRVPGQPAGGVHRRPGDPAVDAVRLHGMWRFGIAASLLSLGAIDFGMVVDSSVVMVENCVRHIAHGELEHAVASSTSFATRPSRCASRRCSANSSS